MIIIILLYFIYILFYIILYYIILYNFILFCQCYRYYEMCRWNVTNPKKVCELFGLSELDY